MAEAPASDEAEGRAGGCEEEVGLAALLPRLLPRRARHVAAVSCLLVWQAGFGRSVASAASALSFGSNVTRATRGAAAMQLYDFA